MNDSSEDAGMPGQTPVTPNAEQVSGESGGFNGDGLSRKASNTIVPGPGNNKIGLFAGESADDLNVTSFGFAQDLNFKSAEQNSEFAAIIGRDGLGVVIASRPFRGLNSKLTADDLKENINEFISRNPGVVVEAVFHTHGCDICTGVLIGRFEAFSPGINEDIGYLNGGSSLGRPLIGFLATPRGRLLRYDPSSSSTRQIGRVYSKRIPEQVLKNLPPNIKKLYK